MWFKSSRTLYTASFLTVTLAVILMSVFGEAGINWAVAVGSGLLAASGVIFTAAVKLHSEERDRSYRFLTEHEKSESLLSAMSFIGRFRALNDILTQEQAAEVYASKDPDFHLICTNVGTVCNFFEEMAIGVRSRQINEYIVREFYSGMLYRAGRFVGPILPVIRNDPPIAGHPFGNVQKPEVYEHMFWLYKRWSPAYETKYLGIIHPANPTPLLIGLIGVAVLGALLKWCIVR